MYNTVKKSLISKANVIQWGTSQLYHTTLDASRDSRIYIEFHFDIEFHFYIEFHFEFRIYIEFHVSQYYLSYHYINTQAILMQQVYFI